MATITTEFGKVDTKKQRAVYLRLRDKKTEMTAMAPDIHYDDSLDASRIASSIVTKRKVESLDFFSFAIVLLNYSFKSMCKSINIIEYRQIIQLEYCAKHCPNTHALSLLRARFAWLPSACGRESEECPASCSEGRTG